MKLLVCILTCHRLDYFIDDCTVDYANQKGWRNLNQQLRVDTIRATWLKNLPADVDYKFFYGTRLRDQKPNQRTPDKIQLREPMSDEVYLACGDGYTSNPEKMKAICAWALEHGYDFILRCDDDTYVYPDRLLVTNFSQFDYVGAGTDPNTFHPGGCMFLSRRAMELIVKGHPTTYADDVWIGQLMRDNGIKLANEPTMWNKWGDGYVVVPQNLPIEKLSSFHSCKPETMRYLHEHRS
jgi:Galactosyltransferase